MQASVVIARLKLSLNEYLNSFLQIQSGNMIFCQRPAVDVLLVATKS